MKLKIKITKEVLEATKMCGHEKEMARVASNCAIAYACRQLFPKSIVGSARIVSVDKSGTYITIAKLPQSATEFIRLFDTSTPDERIQMKPFEFEIELTKEALDSISIDEATKVLEESKTLEVI